ncbi:MAG: ATP-binding protein [Anaerolineae bacterium]
MKLGTRLFLSYLAVIAIGFLVLTLATSFIAPLAFSRTMQAMMGGDHMMMGGGLGSRPGTGIQVLLEDLLFNFRAALSRALWLAGLAAVAAATLASWAVSRRIVQPIHRMAHASQRIADGHYGERLEPGDEDDELGELIASFNRMAAALDEIEAMRRQLIADVSHELKTPLASIKGYMEGLQDGVIAATPETYELIHREAARLERLVQDLQTLSRVEAAQMPMAIVPCEAASIVRAAVEWLRPQFDGKGVTLTAHLPDRPLEVQADFDRVRQVLLNVLGNALQYTPVGGSVAVTLTRRDHEALFSVQDTGVGLEKDDLERVFQRFYRVDKSRSRAGGGSGIGLTIARHIIEAHGGRIWAESDGPGRGSTFRFTLPTS